MKPLDVLTALDAAGKPQEWGHKAHARSKGDAPCSIFDPSRGVCDCGLDVIRPALKAHLAAVARLVEAARRVLNGGDCTCDPAVSGSRTDFCGACELRAALKEVTS